MRAWVRVGFTDDSGTYAVGQPVDYDDAVTERLVTNGILTLDDPRPPAPEPEDHPAEMMGEPPAPPEAVEPEPEVEVEKPKPAKKATKKTTARKKS